jgi:hypothetical protein
MLKNKYGFQVNISLSIFFIAFCDLFTYFPSSSWSAKVCPGLIYKVKVTLRLTASQSVLVSSPLWGPGTYFCPILDKYGLCRRRSPSLTRGRVCHLSRSLCLCPVFTCTYRVTYLQDYVQYIQRLCQSSRRCAANLAVSTSARTATCSPERWQAW